MPEVQIVNLSSLPAEHWQAWFRANLAPGTDWAADPARRVADIGLAADQPLIVIYDPLDLTLAAAMAAGQDFADALQLWEQEADGLLGFWRARRQTTFLVAADLLSGNAEPLRAALKVWNASLLAPVAVAGHEPAALPARLRLLAAQPQLMSRRLRRLCDELAVGGCARPLVGDDLALVRAAHAELQDMASTGQGDQQKLRDEAGALKSRLGAAEQRAARAEQQVIHFEQRAAKAEQQATQLEQRAAKAEQLATQFEQRATKAEQALAALRLRAEDSARESAVQGQRLRVLEEMAERDFHAEQRLAEAHLQIQALDLQILMLRASLIDCEQGHVVLSEDNRLLKMHVDDLHGRLGEFMGSTSWRITAPLRATKRIIGG